MQTIREEESGKRSEQPLTNLPVIFWFALTLIVAILVEGLLQLFESPSYIVLEEGNSIYTFDTIRSFLLSHVPGIILFSGTILAVVFGLSKQHRAKIWWVLATTFVGYVVLTIGLAFLKYGLVLSLSSDASNGYVIAEGKDWFTVTFIFYFLRYAIWVLVTVLTVRVCLREKAVKRTGKKLLGSIAVLFVMILAISIVDMVVFATFEQHEFTLWVTTLSFRGEFDWILALKLTVLSCINAWLIFNKKPLDKV